MKNPRAWLMSVLFLQLANSLRADLIVWTQNGSIYRANSDGSKKRRIFEATVNTGAATGLAYEGTTGKLYWAGRSNPGTLQVGHGIVRRMNLDGSEIERLVDSGMGTTTYGFAVSSGQVKRIYIGEHKAMRYANLDGSGLTTLHVKPLYDAVIRIDEAGRKIYFTEGVIYYGIRRVNLDGTGLENVYRGWTSCFASDFSGKKIYVGTDRDIRRVNLDGSNAEVLVTDVPHLISLQLDPSGKTLYWMTDKQICRRDLDRGKVRIIAKLGQMATIAKDDMIIVADPGNRP